MSRVSNRLDGVTYEAWKGRFNGSVELDQEETDAAAMGELGVAVVAYKITDVGSKLSKDGILTRIPVFTVTEARVVDEDLKQILVDRLGLYRGDVDLPPPLKITPGERTPMQREARAAEMGADPDTGEVLLAQGTAHDELEGEHDLVAEAEAALEDERAEWATRQAQAASEPAPVAEEEPEVLVGDGTMVVGHIADMTRGVGSERHSDGPRSTPFRLPGQEWPDEPVGSPQGQPVEAREHLGQIKVKDSKLAAFLAE